MISKHRKAFNPEYVTHMYWTPTIPIEESKSSFEILVVKFTDGGDLEFKGKQAVEVWNEVLGNDDD